MAKDRNRGNREVKKPKASKKTIAAPSGTLLKPQSPAQPTKPVRKQG